MPEPTAPSSVPQNTDPQVSGDPNTRVDLTERGESVRRTDTRGAYDPRTATDANISTALFGIFIASFVVLGTAADLCTNSDTIRCSERTVAWAIAAGSVSAAFAALWLFMRHCCKLFFRPLTDAILALALTTWWAFGVGFATGAGGIFDRSSNGYFASWVALILSVLYLGFAYGRISSTNYYVYTFSHTLIFILFISLVEMGTSADVCNNHGKCTCRIAWGVAVGAISAGLAIIQLLCSYLAYKMAQATGRLIGTLLLVMWIFGAGFLCTVPNGPYNNACAPNFANGFFSTWAALGASAVFFWRCVVMNVPEYSA